MSELVARRQAIEAASAGLREPGSIYLYPPAVRAKLDKIDRAIVELMRQAREAAGNPVVADGYSGRQSNRRK